MTLVYVLKNWRIMQFTNSAGGIVVRLHGNVFGHERYPPGEDITISAIVSYSKEGETVAVMTASGSEYVLARPSPSEPLALRRLLGYLGAPGTTAAFSAHTVAR
jgi:hypothetical protein